MIEDIALTTLPRPLRLNLLICLLLTACSEAELPVAEEQPSGGAGQMDVAAGGAPAWIGSQACADCHPHQFARWQDSHHDRAMQVADDDAVLGNFDNASFQYNGQRHRFTRDDQRFVVTTDGADGQLADFTVAYTFGVDPLQQYLVRLPDGRIQALPLAWDTRGADSGGQRWMHLYPEGDGQAAIDHASALHWTGPLHNWNFMCAECHSTRVARRYDAAGDRFDTTWQAIDVGCESCHGPGAQHRAWTEIQGSRRPADPAITRLAEGSAAWVMNSDTGIARRQPDRRRHDEVDGCGRCHSRRSQLSEDYRHGDPLLNSHQPALLQQGLYHADGQIDDEVYVYGSFLQSAMYQAGVTCSDCHDPHSLELKAPGNGVCAQCHLPARFDDTKHHGHPPESAGAACVACHMPSRIYMQVDERHDHSFRVPRPDLSLTLGVPNACNACHDDRDARWADQAISRWHGPERAVHYGETIAAGRAGQAGAADRLLALADNPQQPAIVRATALHLLRSNSHPQAGAVLSVAVRSDQGLLRLAAAAASNLLPPRQQAQVLDPLLDDPLRAVRQEAAVGLLLARAVLPADRTAAWQAALEDHRQTLLLFSDRADSLVRLGDLEAALGNIEAAEAAYRSARQRAGVDASAWTNLADLYRAQARESDAQSQLLEGLDRFPNSAELHHSLGLARVRQGDAEGALDHLQKATALAPANPRFAYVYGIALNSRGQPQQALAVLQEAHQRRTGDRDLLLALTTVSRDLGARDQALDYARRLLALAPDNAQARALVAQLEGQE